MLWAVLAGILKTFGGVNEIFGGLGLNYVAQALILWLIFGPWKRAGIASMSGTEPFPEPTGPAHSGGTRLSLWSLALGVVAVIAVYVLLERTHAGLRLKAVGRNRRAAFLLGVPTWQYGLLAFALCGALAGLAGAVQVTAVYHRLIPTISSGYGYLGLMVGMLILYRAIWVAPIALFFAALNIGSIQSAHRAPARLHSLRRAPGRPGAVRIGGRRGTAALHPPGQSRGLATSGRDPSRSPVAHASPDSTEAG